VKGPSWGWLHWGRVSPGLAILGQGCPGVGYSWETQRVVGMVCDTNSLSYDIPSISPMHEQEL